MARGQKQTTEALRLLAAGDKTGALLGLLEGWKATRAPALAERIEAVSDELLAELPPIDLAAHSSTSKAIDARMKGASALDVGPLVVAIERMMRTAPNAYGLMVRLAEAFPDDPRLSSALHRIVMEPPFARSEGALYGRVIQALERCDDPRHVTQIVEWSTRLEQRRRYIRKERADLDVLRDAARRVAKKKRAAIPSWVDEVLRAKPARRKTAPRDASALLEAIYADPTDTARRLVFADVLTERGDPRGEFISLQCGRDPDAKPSARERELLKNYGREWLGPLDSGLRKQGVVYRRGFPAEGRECATDEQHRSPSWATFEVLELDVLTWGERAVTFLDRPALDGLQRLYLDTDSAAQLKRVKPRVHTLGLRRTEAPRLAEVLSSPAFPALAHLEIDQTGGGFLALAKHPRWSQLESLRLTFWSLRELQAFRGVVPALEVIDGFGLMDDRSGWCLRFSGPRLESLHLSCTDKKPRLHGVARSLQTLPDGSLVSITAADPAWLEDGLMKPQLVRLRG